MGKSAASGRLSSAATTRRSQPCESSAAVERPPDQLGRTGNTVGAGEVGAGAAPAGAGKPGIGTGGGGSIQIGGTPGHYVQPARDAGHARGAARRLDDLSRRLFAGDGSAQKHLTRYVDGQLDLPFGSVVVGRPPPAGKRNGAAGHRSVPIGARPWAQSAIASTREGS